MRCHHVGVVSFDAILKRTKAKYVLGLTTTPIRRDGQQLIIFMQCGPIRHAAATPAGAPHDLEVVPRPRHARIDMPLDAGIQDVFRHLANDQARTEAIAAEVRDAFMAEAEASHRPASQVVRELMREFIERQRQAREYDAFLRAKVDTARAQIASGQVRSDAEVEG